MLRKFYMAVLICLILLVSAHKSEAYNIVVSDRTLPSSSTTVPYNTTTLLGYLEPDFGAELYAFYNITNRIEIDVLYTNSKTGTFTLTIREDDQNGAIVYQSVWQITNSTSRYVRFTTPTQMIQANVNKLAVYAHHNLVRFNPNPVETNVTVTSGSDGAKGWKVVNIDRPTKEILDKSALAKEAAEQARDAAMASHDDINYIRNDLLSISAGIIQDNSGTVLDAARAAASDTTYIRDQLPQLISRIDNISIPPVIKLRTMTGALATSGNTINAIVSTAGNENLEYTYSVNNGEYLTLPQDGIITLNLTNPGPNIFRITVKDLAGNYGTDTITIRKL